MNASSRPIPTLSTKALTRCFLRCYLVGANFNTRGMQNVGLALAMEPGLQLIHVQTRSRQQALRRALQHYNTHPYWTPLLVGIFLSLERDIARGILPASMLQRIKTTTTCTLSALGDSFFSGATLVFFALILALLVINGWVAGAWTWLGLCFLGLQVFKLFTFVGGLREGISFLNRLKRWDLINWGQRIKTVNAGLLALIWLQFWPDLEGRLGAYLGFDAAPGLDWLCWSLAVIIGALCCLRWNVSRIWLLLAFAGYWTAWFFMTA